MIVFYSLCGLERKKNAILSFLPLFLGGRESDVDQIMHTVLMLISYRSNIFSIITDNELKF